MAGKRRGSERGEIAYSGGIYSISYIDWIKLLKSSTFTRSGPSRKNRLAPYGRPFLLWGVECRRRLLLLSASLAQLAQRLTSSICALASLSGETISPSKEAKCSDYSETESAGCHLRLGHMAVAK